MNNKLSTLLPDMYKEMHSKSAFDGRTWKQCTKQFSSFIGNDYPVLDFGCGPRGGLAGLKRSPENLVISYDPYIEAYSTNPWEKEFKTFFSCDVFEHLPEWELSNLLLCLRNHKSCQKIFVSISTRPANKLLPNNLNAHLIIQPASWWYGAFVGTLSGVYKVERALSDMSKGECLFGLIKE